DHLAVGHGQVEALHGEEASEALGEPAHLEQAQRAILHDRARRATKGAAPWGRKSTTAMRSEPYTIRWPPDQPVAAKYLRESSASGERMKEPRTGPSGVPAPPTMGRMMISTESGMPKSVLGWSEN